MNAYKPGDVCVATVRGVPNVRVMRVTDPFHSWRAEKPCLGAQAASDDEVTDVRPLVVLDPERAPYPLVGSLREQVEGELTPHTSRWLLEQIEAQTRPPKPPEPQGLGAVVEDAAGGRWVRAALKSGNSWHKPIGTWSRYEHIDVVRVLSEGVTP